MSARVDRPCRNQRKRGSRATLWRARSIREKEARKSESGFSSFALLPSSSVGRRNVSMAALSFLFDFSFSLSIPSRSLPVRPRTRAHYSSVMTTVPIELPRENGKRGDAKGKRKLVEGERQRDGVCVERERKKTHYRRDDAHD